MEHRLGALFLKFGAHGGELHQVAHLVVASSRFDLLVAPDMQLTDKGFQHVVGHIAVVDQPDRTAVLAPVKPVEHLLGQALRHVAVERELGVADDLEGVGRNRVVAEHEENIVEEQPDYVVEEYHVGAPARGGKHHEAWAGVAHRYLQDGVTTVLGPCHLHRQIYLAVGQERQLDALAQDQRHEADAHHRIEIVAAELALLRGEALLVDHIDPVVLHLGDDLRICRQEYPARGFDAAVDKRQELLCRVPAAELGRVFAFRLGEAYDIGQAHADKLVLVVRKNAQKP